MDKDIRKVISQFGLTPHNLALYKQAFTHKSVNGAAGQNAFDYERLEFLGDSIVGMVVSDLVYNEHPELNQGGLSKLKASFIKTQSEASYSLKYHFDTCIVVGKSFQGEVKDNLSILEDVFESVIGAVYLDQGLDITYKLVRSFFEDDVKKASFHPESDPKSLLQEELQSESKESVSYKILSEEGPGNSKTFTAAVYFEGVELGRGEGKSKKEAEMAAAALALSKRAKG